MNILLSIAVVTPEITKLLSAIEVMKQELKLFKLLNGLEMSPLPKVELAYVAVQQEESQKEVLSHVGIGIMMC